MGKCLEYFVSAGIKVLAVCISNSGKHRFDASTHRRAKAFNPTCRLKFSVDFHPLAAMAAVAAAAQRNLVSYQCLISRIQSPIYRRVLRVHPPCCRTLLPFPSTVASLGSWEKNIPLKIIKLFKTLNIFHCVILNIPCCIFRFLLFNVVTINA